MKNPVALATRHVRVPGASATAWGLELVLQLHRPQGRGRQLFQRCGFEGTDEFFPRFISVLRAHGITTETVSYGSDFARFESDLARQWREPNGCRFPLVRLPATAETAWSDTGLHINSCTLIAAGTRARPVFLLRPADDAGLVTISLAQLRSLHTAWASWPVMLPSALLTVLWHWSDRILPATSEPGRGCTIVQN
ncbi:MAG TPA: hypothetical protein PLF88_02570 [Opitutaceae bacterium]|nr:hypothetical protein [Opitutaceae bacterium]HRJ46259.1 hypothetical protein [Opitutaceae bacterium]